MKFDTVLNKEKAYRNTVDTTDMIEFKPCEGNTVCYHQPIYENSLLSLRNSIGGSQALKNLAGKYYNIRTNNKYISEVYPTVEYHKIAFRMIRDNLHTIMLSKQEIAATSKSIQTIFAEQPEFLDTGQRKISFDKEIYKLRSDISNFTFTIRTVLDILSTLFQTIYGPQAGQYSSFNSLLKQLNKDNGRLKYRSIKKYINSDQIYQILHLQLERY
ncbi:MAG: hypothetical protein D3917_09575 [Candidatus Electrothrix sp. AX5]|nr:hypothetical protein [Candidatus Electrothrix sp. AX5]